MASREDAFAQQRGFKNYYQYRVSVARSQGYASYSEQQKARKTGIGLKGADAANPRYIARTPAPPPKPRAPTFGEQRFRAPERAPVDTHQRIAGHLLKINQAEAQMRNTQAQVATRFFEVEPSARLRIAQQTREQMAAYVQQMAGPALDFYGTPLGEIYRDAALGANPGYKFTEDDARILTALQSRGRQDLTEAAGFTQHDANRFLADLKKQNKLGPDQRASWSQRNRIIGRVYADGQRRTFAQYANLSIAAAAQRAANLATIKASGAAFFIVTDGADCGLTSHDDPQKVNGQVLNAVDAATYPIAHPHCQRQFTPVTQPGPGRGLFEAATAAISQQAVELGVNAAAEGARRLAESRGLQKKVAELGAKFVPGAWGEKLDVLARQIRTEDLAANGIADLTARRASRDALLQDVADEQFDVAEGVATPERLQSFLDVQERPVARAVGDNFDQFMDFNDQTVRATMSVDDLTRLDRIENFSYEFLSDHVGTIGNRVARFTFPKIGLGEKAQAGRFTFEPNQLIQTTITKTERGLINHLSLNKHGLLRAGFTRDPESGLISPTFRAVPAGPIRILARVNRSVGKELLLENLPFDDSTLFSLRRLDVGDTMRIGENIFEKIDADTVLRGRGKVTSVSTELRLTTKLPVNFSANFNLNLRKLGIHSWRDIRNLSVEDFRKLGLSDAKFVSAAAEVRAMGFGPLSVAKTFRVNWEDAQSLWELTSQWLEEQSSNPGQIPGKIIEGIQAQISDTVARRRREHFIQIFGEEEWNKKLASEQFAAVRSRVDDQAWFAYEQHAGRAYYGTTVVDMVSGDIGTVTKTGPSYVTVDYEGRVVKYPWETVNQRTKILK